MERVGPLVWDNISRRNEACISNEVLDCQIVHTSSHIHMNDENKMVLSKSSQRTPSDEFVYHRNSTDWIHKACRRSTHLMNEMHWLSYWFKPHLSLRCCFLERKTLSLLFQVGIFKSSNVAPGPPPLPSSPQYSFQTFYQAIKTTPFPPFLSLLSPTHNIKTYHEACAANAAGLLTTKITESPLRNILLTYLSLFTAVPLLRPLPPLEYSVHISFTSSRSLIYYINDWWGWAMRARW